MGTPENPALSKGFGNPVVSTGFENPKVSLGFDAEPVTAAELGEHIGMATRSVVELAKRGIAVKAGAEPLLAERERCAVLRRPQTAGAGSSRPDIQL